MATNRFVCEVCGKGFQRDQNLQLHRRGHNLPWKLKQREEQEIRKRVYVCPEASCVHHDPSRALGDLTGIKKHFFRKHGEKKWKCERCCKRYAVQSDWKAHRKVCGTREYRCDCGSMFSRRDSYITHRAFCDALVEETGKISANQVADDQHCGELEYTRTPRMSSDSKKACSSSFSHLASVNVDAACVRDDSDLRQRLEKDAGIDPPSLVEHERPEAKEYGRGKDPGLSLYLGPGPPELSAHIKGCMGAAAVSVTSEDSCLGFGHDEMMYRRPSSGLGALSGVVESSIPISEPWGEFYSTRGCSEPWSKETQTQFTSTMVGLSVSASGSFNNSACSLIGHTFSGAIPNKSVSGNGFMNRKPSSYVPRHAGPAQMPATALLQKAAIMGATSTTSSSVFNGFRGDPRLIGIKKVVQREPLLAANRNILSPNLHPLPIPNILTRDFSMDFSHGSKRQQVKNSFNSEFSSDQGTLQEFLNSLCSAHPSVFQSHTDDIDQC
ncbi:hypothetical protein KP509_13G054600 [Ceratopteris richardii]|nr:hypothetical protein KP509_13G054600 [Ceratopteris richardii]KAH7421388.1 hypothetical protein KP509_13G054600 [Ceratopteris richardii]KAH7421389.1 hypothetical protein KP509_13G054600 [Ceratopteris richardii]